MILKLSGIQIIFDLSITLMFEVVKYIKKKNYHFMFVFNGQLYYRLEILVCWGRNSNL